MPYCSQQDVFARYNKVATVNLTAQEWGVFIGDATAMIDAALAERYTVPLATTPEETPPIVRSVCAWFTLGLMLDRMPNTPPWIVRMIERQEAVLKALREGDLTIVGPGGAVVPESADVGTVKVSTSGYTPTFGVAPSLNEEVDPDRASDEENARG